MYMWKLKEKESDAKIYIIQIFKINNVKFIINHTAIYYVKINSGVCIPYAVHNIKRKC